MLISIQDKRRMIDPFWDEAAQLLLQALISYLRERFETKEQNLHNLLKLVSTCEAEEGISSLMDRIMDEHARKNPNSYAVSTYAKFRVAANKTLRSILITINARLGLFDTPEVTRMTATDDIAIKMIGQEKTALFVVISDTDRSLDDMKK